MTTKYLFLIVLCLSSLLATSCRRNGGEVWEDTKTSGRYMGRGFRALGGKHGDSRQICDRSEFYTEPMYVAAEPPATTPRECEFVALQDESGNDLIAMENVVMQPKESPGEPGSSIPGIEAFRDPSTIPALAGIFSNINFEYNSDLIKGQKNLDIIKQIADYLKKHPTTYIFSEGHADERGPDAYNLALGSKRSNAVRNMLIKEGVSPDNIFTISYGKERPLVFGHDEETWGLNRRVEFKVYQK